MRTRSLTVLVALAIACAACNRAEAPAPPAAALAAASPGVLVAFREPHPLAHAQALEAQGRHGEAADAARAAIAQDAALAGLCFDRLTAGGAEIVFRPCAPMPAEAGDAFVRERARSLALLPGVVYAEPNLVAAPEA